ncbi:MAG: hypothetical protein AAF798_15965 [Bacteroidota bacterium]
MDPQILKLKRKVKQYKEVLQNTRNYRQDWQESLKAKIITTLEAITKDVGLEAKIEERADMENLEAIILSLGNSKSGMYQTVESDIKRHLIKHNGSLVYQQLFNGKVIVLIQYPFIEGYGKPQPPKNIAIYRPEELTEPFFIRHVEEFVNTITHWEDYDDDEQPNNKIGFQMSYSPSLEE